MGQIPPLLRRVKRLWPREDNDSKQHDGQQNDHQGIHAIEWPVSCERNASSMVSSSENIPATKVNGERI